MSLKHPRFHPSRVLFSMLTHGSKRPPAAFCLSLVICVSSFNTRIAGYSEMLAYLNLRPQRHGAPVNSWLGGYEVSNSLACSCWIKSYHLEKGLRLSNTTSLDNARDSEAVEDRWNQPWHISLLHIPLSSSLLWTKIWIVPNIYCSGLH